MPLKPNHTDVVLNIEQQVNQAVKDHLAHTMQDVGESSKADNASAHERIDQIEQSIAQAAQSQSAQAEQRFRGMACRKKCTRRGPALIGVFLLTFRVGKQPYKA